MAERLKIKKKKEKEKARSEKFLLLMREHDAKHTRDYLDVTRMQAITRCTLPLSHGDEKLSFPTSSTLKCRHRSPIIYLYTIYDYFTN